MAIGADFKRCSASDCGMGSIGCLDCKIGRPASRNLGSVSACRDANVSGGDVSRIGFSLEASPPFVGGPKKVSKVP